MVFSLAFLKTKVFANKILYKQMKQDDMGNLLKRDFSP